MYIGFNRTFSTTTISIIIQKYKQNIQIVTKESTVFNIIGRMYALLKYIIHKTSSWDFVGY